MCVCRSSTCHNRMTRPPKSTTQVFWLFINGWVEEKLKVSAKELEDGTRKTSTSHNASEVRPTSHKPPNFKLARSHCQLRIRTLSVP